MTFTVSQCRRLLAPSVERAWRAFDHASSLPSRVTSAAPILFFGDLDAYCTSALRVVTVGLNPSLHEFPSRDPFRRFPLDGGSSDRELDRYLDAMSAYFGTDPYSSWFNTFEPLLNGAGSSYYGKRAESTALHTDICSPVATDPTWTELGRPAQAALEEHGGPLWHELLKVLQPQIVAISVARAHLGRIKFERASDWEIVHRFERKGDGSPRSRPYELQAQWCAVGDEPSLFVFGQAAQKPFGTLHHKQKLETGEIALRKYHDDR